MLPLNAYTDRFLAATVLRVVPFSIRPNHVTVIRFVLIPFVLWFVLAEWYMFALITFAIAAFTDALDGAMARTRNQETALGRIIDPLADKALIAVIAFPLFTEYLSWTFVGLLVALEVLAGFQALYYLKWRGIGVKAIWTGKTKMIFQSIGIVLLFVYILGGGVAWFTLAFWALWISMVFLAITPPVAFFEYRKLSPRLS